MQTGHNNDIELVITPEGAPLDESEAAIKSPIVRFLSALTLFAAIGMAIALFPTYSWGTGDGGVGAALRRAFADPMTLLAARSPGARGEVTTQSKPYPSYRVASTGRERPDAPVQSFVGPMGGGDDAAPMGAFLPAESPVQEVAVVDAIDESFRFFPGQPLPIVGAPIFFDQPDTTDETPTEPDASAVPEPASWVIMMIGLFVLGSRLRARTHRTHALTN